LSLKNITDKAAVKINPTAAIVEGQKYTYSALFGSHSVSHLKESTPNNTYKECRNKNCNFDHGPIPNPFDSPEHKTFYIGATTHIRDAKIRDWVRGELATIPP
jgi:hypothetical protein